MSVSYNFGVIVNAILEDKGPAMMEHYGAVPFSKGQLQEENYVRSMMIGNNMSCESNIR